MNYTNIDNRIHSKSATTGAAKDRQLTIVVDRSGHRHLILRDGLAPLRRGFRLLTQIGAVCIALLGATVEVRSATFTIQPTTEETSKETKIYTSVPTSNFSSNLNIVSLDVGAHFLSLVQFDLSSLAAVPAADISNAMFSLYSTGLGISGGPVAGGTVTISPILNDWRETAASPGSAPLATYNAFFGSSPTLSYGAAVASQTVSGPGFVAWDVTSLVQSWKDGSQANYGMLVQLSSGGGDIGFADVDSNPEVLGSAPSLTVTSVPEPSTVMISFACMGAFLLRRRRSGCQRQVA